MQLHISWYVYGPRAETGASALAALIREIGTAQAPVVVSAPARVTNVRRELVDGVLDDGLAADIVTNLPRLSGGSASGTQPFFPPGSEERLAAGNPLTGAALTAALDALKPVLLSSINTATSVQIIIDIARPLTETQVRAWRAQANRVLGAHLSTQGCRLQANGISARLLGASPSYGGAGALLLLALGFGYYMTRERT